VGLYSIGGRHGAVAATNNHAAGALWNPHSTKRLWVVDMSWAVTAGGATSPRIALIRTSTQGAPGSTVTPGIGNAWEGDVAPPTGAVLDLAAYSVQPTLQPEALWRDTWAPTVGIGFQKLFPEGICVPPGTGLAMITTSFDAIDIGDLTFIWRESD
jgi:hypothetical protein